jgi:hypothetical protein
LVIAGGRLVRAVRWKREDRVVVLDPSSPLFRDSRGLARALTGARVGAIEDFRPCLERRLRAA